MLDAAYYADLGLSSIYDKVLEGRRLEPEEGLALFRCPDLTAVGALACTPVAAVTGTGPFMSLTARSTIPTSASTAACSAPSGATTRTTPARLS